MEIKHEELVQIKHTKSLEMYHNIENGSVRIVLGTKGDGKVWWDEEITIPNKNVWSLIRGLLSDRQRFYRRKK